MTLLRKQLGGIGHSDLRYLTRVPVMSQTEMNSPKIGKSKDKGHVRLDKYSSALKIELTVSAKFCLVQTRICKGRSPSYRAEITRVMR